MGVDENGSNEERPAGSTGWDVAIEIVRAIRDIFNDWRVATAFMVTVVVAVLLIAGKLAGAELFEGVKGWICAWRNTC